jgi:hypothetical protein
LRCADEVQRGMAGYNAEVLPDNRIEFRIGINVGDIVVEDGDIFGDGVNVAARLEGLAAPGGICVTARVQEDAAGKLDLVFEDLGEPSSSRTVTSLAAASMSRHASKDWRSQSTSSESRTEVRATLRWRGMDSNFQYAEVVCEAGCRPFSCAGWRRSLATD